MHNYKRNILRGSTLLILAVAIVLLILLIQRQRQPNPDSFLCTAKTVTNIQPKNFNVSGSIVLDFKKKRITLQYDIITNEQVKKYSIEISTLITYILHNRVFILSMLTQ